MTTERARHEQSAAEQRLQAETDEDQRAWLARVVEQWGILVAILEAREG